MIPDNPNLLDIGPAERHLIGPFLFPDNLSPGSPLESYEMGGIAIQDPSQGLQVQPWYGYWDPEDETVYLCPNITGTPIALFTESDVVAFGFTFDQNMRWSTITLSSEGHLKHKWYDAAVANYVTSDYPDVSSAAVSLDDKRDLQIQAGVSDIILTYVDLVGGIHWRIQRDRFLALYTHTKTVPIDYRISHFGMNERNRLQWRFERNARS